MRMGGGGVCLLIKNDIAFIPVYIKSNLEVIAAKVGARNHPHLAGARCHPPRRYFNYTSEH